MGPWKGSLNIGSNPDFLPEVDYALKLHAWLGTTELDTTQRKRRIEEFLSDLLEGHEEGNS